MAKAGKGVVTPGNRTQQGRFVPGVSGNPNGRPKIEGRIRELAQQHGEKAIEVLFACLDDEDPKVRIAAAEALLNRGYGKPSQGIAFTDPEGNAVKHPLLQVVVRK